MSHLKKCLGFAIGIACLYACKKESPNSGGSAQREIIPEVTEALNMLEFAAYDFENFMQLYNNDTLKSFLATGQMMYADPNVEEVWAYGTDEIIARYKSGLETSFTWIQLDNNDQPLTRGGGLSSSYNTLTGFKRKSLTADEKLIANQKVLLYSPGFELKTKDVFFKNKIETFSSAFDVDVLYQNAADFGKLQTFKDYGLVIINTHGHHGSFEIYSGIPDFDVPLTIDTNGLTAADVEYIMFANQKPILDAIAEGSLRLGVQVYLGDNNTLKGKARRVISVTSDYVRKLPSMDDAVVFLNFCYSGYQASGPVTKNLPEAFMSLGAKTVYAYAHSDKTSSPVYDVYASIMEDSIISNLIIKGDSTGIAHLENDMLLQYDTVKNHFGSKTYSHTFFKLYNPRDSVKLEDFPDLDDYRKALSKALDFTFDIPRINRDLWFYHYGDEGYKYEQKCDTIIDPRDQQKYGTVCINGQRWFSQNLNYETGTSWCYSNDTANCSTYGRLYDWNTANTACPSGWHLPQSFEWNAMINFLGGGGSAGGHMKTTIGWTLPNMGASNSSGWSALPGGYYDGGAFKAIGETGAWWSATENGTAVERFNIVNWEDQISKGFDSKNLGYSCRCVKD